MAINSAQLLKLLEPAVRPGAASHAGRRGPIEGQSFDQLLASASKGHVASGRQIEVGFDAEPPLDGEQLERLATAADQAEAAGAQKVMLFMDGRAFALDVASRTVTTELAQGSEAQLLKVDAAMLVHGGEDGASNQLKLLPGMGVSTGLGALSARTRSGPPFAA